ncbi:MAG: hypothetical protein Q9160_000701 [Pyrenula sp. 1 TL-2023]
MLALSLTAELNGCATISDPLRSSSFSKSNIGGSVTDFQPVDTAENPYYYSFKVQCTSCREVHANWVGVSRFETHDMSGSRGESNFVWRCKNCKRESAASIKTAPKPYTAETASTRINVIEIDCRGCEFVEFRPDGTFQATGTDSNTKFPSIEFDESSEWYDYDEKAGEEVSVKECRWEIRRA